MCTHHMFSVVIAVCVEKYAQTIEQVPTAKNNTFRKKRVIKK